MIDGNVLGIAAYNDAEAFSNLIEALRVAEAAAKQLAFYREQPDWLKVEFQLGTFREHVTRLAMAALV